METEETPPQDDLAVDPESSVLMETTGSEVSDEIQTPSTPEVLKVAALTCFLSIKNKQKMIQSLYFSVKVYYGGLFCHI